MVVFLVAAVVLGVRAIVSMAVVVALVVGVVLVVAVVAALGVGVCVGAGAAEGVRVGVGVGVFLQAVLCEDLVVVVSVCVALVLAKGAVAAFTVAAVVLWVLAVAVGGGGVTGLQRGGLKVPSTSSKKNRTKFTMTVYSDSVQ